MSNKFVRRSRIYLQIEMSNLNSASDDSGEEDSDGCNNDNVKNIYQIPISEKTADHLYDIAGTEEEEINNELVILPSP